MKVNGGNHQSGLTYYEEWLQQYRVQAIALMPLSKADLRGLFEWLTCIGIEQCDHSLKYTQQYLNQRSLSQDLIIPWLKQNGGYCDCEVLFNVQSKLGDFI